MATIKATGSWDPMATGRSSGPAAAPKRSDDPSRVGSVEGASALPMIIFKGQTVYLGDICPYPSYAQFVSTSYGPNAADFIALKARLGLTRDEFTYLREHCPDGVLAGKIPAPALPVGAIQYIEELRQNRLFSAEQMARLRDAVAGTAPYGAASYIPQGASEFGWKGPGTVIGTLIETPVVVEEKSKNRVLALTLVGGVVVGLVAYLVVRNRQ